MFSGRIIEDDSDEYDSEMDDFIDDGSDCDQLRISEEIQNIFGYDKNRSVDSFQIDILVLYSMPKNMLNPHCPTCSMVK